MQPSRLDFATLNQQAGFAAWNNTFAYWLLVLHDPGSPYARTAEEAQAAMSFQYDAEEQAVEAEEIASDTDLIPSVFVPIAPVTLALGWSPFPAASELLGLPLHGDVRQGSVLAVFAPQQLTETAGLAPDARHFSFLLQQACARASRANALVLLVGSPGWDYEEAGYLAENFVSQRAMQAFGFVHTLRRPAAR